MTYPVEISHVALTVNDLTGMRDFYANIVGLMPLTGDGETATLGAGGRTLLELRADRHAPRPPRNAAGLFHTAFLMPERGDLGRWLRHAAETGQQLSGASDHAVSEAVYLSDPEGNGIEIYIDRPESSWQRNGDQVNMITERMDIEGVLAAGHGPWMGMPDGSKVGHVHLSTSGLSAARDFATGQLGLTETLVGQGGAWFGSGGYHHQLAANIWNSRGAGPRRFPSIGLAEIGLTVTPESGLTSARITDPDGTGFILKAA